MHHRTTPLNVGLLLIISFAATLAAGAPIVAKQAESPLYLPFLAQQPTAPAVEALPTPTAASQPGDACTCSGNLDNRDDFGTQVEVQTCYDRCVLPTYRATTPQ